MLASFAPARRLYVENQLANVTTEQAHRLLATWETGKWPSPPPSTSWGEAAPTPPHLLEGEHCPLTGRPLDDPPQSGEIASAAGAREQRNYLRFQAWAELDAQSKSQKVCDLLHGKEDSPSWLCQVTGEPNSGQPALIIKAASAELAMVRYTTICGLLSLDPTHKIVAQPYVAEDGQ
jgi:hypothetical protein